MKLQNIGIDLRNLPTLLIDSLRTTSVYAILKELIPKPRKKAQVFRAAIFPATVFAEMTRCGHIGLAFRYWETNGNIRAPTAYDASFHFFRAFQKGRVTFPVGQRSHYFHHASVSPYSLAIAFFPLSHRFDRISKERKGRRTLKTRRTLQAGHKGISKASPPFVFIE